TITVTPLVDALVEGDEDVQLILDAQDTSGYVLGTPERATITIADLVPLVTLEATDPFAAEARDTATFTLTRSGPTSAALPAYYPGGGTATPGADYARLSGSVTIPAGSATATFVVTPVDDSLFEPNESIDVTLSANPAYSPWPAGGDSVYIIDDNDGTPTVA